MSFPNEHSARLQNPEMKRIKVRRTHGSGDAEIQGSVIPKNIDVLWYIREDEEGNEDAVAQSLRYSDSDWSDKGARGWLKNHKIKYIKFESAKKKEKQSMDNDSVKCKKSFPVNSFKLSSEASVKFAGGDEGEKNKFQMVANSGEVILNHWAWGNIVIDMAGVEVGRKNKPALREHDSERIVGWTEEIQADAKNGILAQGIFSETTKDGQSVLALIQEGFPFQASIYIPPTKIEELKAGEETEVNGRTFKGPGHIFRKSVLREVSFCALGADENTHAVAMSENNEVIEIDMIGNIENEEKSMELKDVTVDQLKAERKDLIDQIESDTKEKFKGEFETAQESVITDKVSEETARVTDILKKAGEFEASKELALGCVENKLSVEDAESKFKDEKLKRLENSSPASPGTQEPNDDQFSGLEGEELHKAQYEKTASLKSEFLTLENYLAYKKADDAGLVKIKSDRK